MDQVRFEWAKRPLDRFSLVRLCQARLPRALTSLHESNAEPGPLLPKRDRGRELKPLTWQEIDPKALRHGGEHHRRLHHGEVIADADPRAAAEREIGEARELLRALGPEAFRVEALWVGKPARISVNDPLRREDLRALGNDEAANLDGFEHLAARRPGWRIEPHRLLQDALGIRQRLHVVGRWQAAAKHTVHLGV